MATTRPSVCLLCRWRKGGETKRSLACKRSYTALANAILVVEAGLDQVEPAKRRATVPGAPDTNDGTQIYSDSNSAQRAPDDNKTNKD